ncbi:MAG: YchJ family protein [Kiritimatiellae bacterium]|nr:YchJ family protein [Kiritimatiellia bacterium]
MNTSDPCPCRSGKSYGECCGPVISGERKAATAVELMRARYSAYAVGDAKFLYESSGPEVRAEFDEKSTLEWSKGATWEGIDVLYAEKGGAEDDEGFVSFVAHYTAKGNACEHREQSYFKRIDGDWRFIDGKIDTGEPYRREEPKIGRNDPCPCGSGKKYKKCCGR